MSEVLGVNWSCQWLYYFGIELNSRIAILDIDIRFRMNTVRATDMKLTVQLLWRSGQESWILNLRLLCSANQSKEYSNTTIVHADTLDIRNDELWLWLPPDAMKIEWHSTSVPGIQFHCRIAKKLLSNVVSGQASWFSRNFARLFFFPIATIEVFIPFGFWVGVSHWCSRCSVLYH